MEAKAESYGISLQEYMRHLMLNDLKNSTETVQKFSQQSSHASVSKRVKKKGGGKKKSDGIIDTLFG
jgi:hypothetical protein